MIQRVNVDRGRESLGVLGGVLLGFMAWQGAALSEARGAAWYAPLLLQALAAVGVLVALRFAWMLIDRRPALEFGAEGVWAPRQMTEPLRWDEVEALRMRVSHLRTIRRATLEIVPRGADAPAASLELLKLKTNEKALLKALAMHHPIEGVGAALSAEFENDA